MSAIFISHSSKDNEFCEKLMAWLSDLGHRSVFLDFDESSGIVAGQSWEQKLYKELRACRAMIVVCTENLMESKWCFAEITHARSLGKPIFPLKITSCEINTILSDSQIIDFLKYDEQEGFVRLKQGLVKAGIDAKDPYDWDGSRPPYPGLLAFQEEDAAIFFGRDKEIGEGLDKLTTTHRYGGSGLVMTLGASGSGKSSLVRAGIIPRLKRDPERWLVLNPMQPGDDPFRELAKRLKMAFRKYVDEERSIDELYDQLTANAGIFKVPPKVSEDITQSKKSDAIYNLHEAVDRKNASVLLVVDQFEELLDRPSDHLGSRFLFYLKSILEKRGSRIIVLGTMRSDFLGTFQQNDRMQGLEFKEIRVGPIDTASLTEIIKKPAVLAGVEVEPKLLQALIEDTRTNDALPLLAFTLRELYDKYSDDNLLEYREYQDLGGIQGAVAKAAEGVLSHPKISAQQEESLRKAFLQMTRVNEQGNFTRNVANWSDMPAEIHDTLKRLVDGRLLVSSGGEDDNRTIEVAHEAIFKSWKRLRIWLDEDREFFLWRRRLNNAIEEWEHNNRDKSALLYGSVLNEARTWFDRYNNQLEIEEKFYLDESFNEAARYKRKWQIRNSILIAITVCILITISYLYFNAENERKIAETETKNAQSLTIAAFAREQINKNPTIAISLAEIAWNIAPYHPPAIPVQRVINEIFHGRNSLFYEHDFRGHTGPVTSTDISVDGTRIVTASSDGTAKVWDATSGELTADFVGHTGNVISAVFSMDGTRVVTASSDSTVKIWDTESRTKITDLKEHAHFVNSAVFSPDGSRIVTASSDKTVKVWDAGSGAKTADLIGHSGSVYSAIFSQDGTRIATVSADGSVKLWNTASGKEVANLAEHTGPVNSVVFSGDGTRIVTASSDRTAKVWNAESGAKIVDLIGHTDYVKSALFSTDETRIVTASYDKTAKVWDAQSGAKLADFIGHTRGVKTAAFSPDGRRIVTASYDQTAKVWDAESGKKLADLIGHTNYVNCASFFMDGKRILTASSDNTAKLWDATYDKGIPDLIGHRGKVNSAVFSADATYIVTASSDHTAKVWDSASGEITANLIGHTQSVNSAVFSADATRIMTTSHDKTVRVWDAASGKEIGDYIKLSGIVNSATFSKDGTRIVTTSGDSTAKVWDAVSVKKVADLIGHTGVVTNAVFSADGTRIVTTSGDNTAKLWDASSGKEVGDFIGHSDDVESAVYSHDGTRIVTASNDGTVKVWDAASFKIITDLIGYKGGVNNAVFSRDGTRIVVAFKGDDTAIVWESASGKKIADLIGHTDVVTSAVFSPDGSRIVTASHDNTAKVWDAASGKKIADLIGHNRLVSNAVFSPDGSRIVTASHDNTAKLWILPERVIEWLNTKNFYSLTQDDLERIGIYFIDLEKVNE